jgi:hypothetical protein
VCLATCRLPLLTGVNSKVVLVLFSGVSLWMLKTSVELVANRACSPPSGAQPRKLATLEASAAAGAAAARPSVSSAFLSIVAVPRENEAVGML